MYLGDPARTNVLDCSKIGKLADVIYKFKLNFYLLARYSLDFLGYVKVLELLVAFLILYETNVAIPSISPGQSLYPVYNVSVFKGFYPVLIEYSTFSIIKRNVLRFYYLQGKFFHPKASLLHSRDRLAG